MDAPGDSGTTDELASARAGGGVTPNFADGDPCIQPTMLPNMFCPYNGTTSDHSFINCNRSIRTELGAAPTEYAPVMIGGVSTAYVQPVTLGTISGVPLVGVRVGKIWTSGPPIPQMVVYGGQHAREWITTETLMRNFRHFASSFRDNTNGVRALLADRAILFIPVANPNGYARTHAAVANRLWRPNFTSCGLTPSGTDPNRNAPMSFGHVGAGNACSTSPGSFYQGPSAGSEAETGALLASFGDVGRYRTVLGVNTHAHGNFVLFTEGLSTTIIVPPPTVPPTPLVFTPCGTDSNCSAPDLGLFYRLAGTERVPRLRDEEVPSVPYVVGSVFRSIYAASGDTATETVYGSLPGSTPRFMSLSTEITHTGCGFYAEQLPIAQLEGVANNYKDFLSHLTTQVDELASGTVEGFDLPVVQRRASTGIAAEYPTWRLAARSSFTGFTLTPVGGGSGSTTVDDVRDGVFYRQYRFTPSSPYLVPGRLQACATGWNCRTMSMEGATGPVNLCDSSRFVPGAGWNWFPDNTGGPQDECFWRFSGTGASSLTSTNRNLQYMGSSRLVFSYRWRKERVRGHVEVSSNGFVGCSDTNYGNCRIVGRFDSFYGGTYEFRNTSYRTAIFDVADFDGKTPVQSRFVVDSTMGTSGVPDWDIYDPVFVGWYTGP